MGFNPREWALRWLKGSIVSYVRDGISLVMLFGRVKRCLMSYGVGVDEVKALVEVVILDPALNLGSVEERRRKLEPLLKFLDEWSGGVR